jgi:antitoxin CptB
MTGTTRSSAELDPRRRRLLFRAWHRGIREMDLILGSFADREIATLDEPGLDEFERILGVDDRDLIRWVVGEIATPDAFDTPMFKRITAFRPETLAMGGTDR